MGTLYPSLRVTMGSDRRIRRVRPRSSAGRLLSAALIITGLLVLGACSTRGVVPIERIPSLAAEYERDPSDGELRRRLAASYAAAGDCVSASAITAGAEPTAADAWPVLVDGVCRERVAGGDTAAIRAYREYLGRYPEGRGATLVRGRLLLAEEREAVRRAGTEPTTVPDNDVVAVVPLRLVSADPRYAALEVGLAALLITDLQLLGRFPLVERLSIRKIADELELADDGLVDPATAARLGRIVQAGRLVTGSIAIPADGTIAVDVTVTSAIDARSTGSGLRSARLEELFDLEKELVFDIARQLGYAVSEADRERILQNGTRNLQAFLAYSQGLEALDRGDYATATARLAEATRLDGGFTSAREMLQASEGARASEAVGGADVLAAEAEAVEGVESAIGGSPVGGALETALHTAIFDIAPTQSEGATSPSGERKLNSVVQQPAAPSVPRLLRIVVIIPGG